MEVDLTRFHAVFFQEADEHLAQMEAGLLRLERGDSDPELLNDIFRGAHSLKGSSGMFGFDELTHFTHALETLLDQLRSGKPTSPEINRLLFQALDELKELVETAHAGGSVKMGDAASEIVSKLLAAAETVTPAGVETPRVELEPEIHIPDEKLWKIRFVPAPEIFERAMDPILVLRQLDCVGRVIKIQCDLSRLPSLTALDPEVCYLGWDLELASSQPIEEIQDVFAFVEDGAEILITEATPAETELLPAETEPQPPSTATKHVRENASIRVGTEKVDKMIDLVGELVIAQAMAAQILRDFAPSRLPALKDAFEGLERYTRELQERVMTVRMVPVGSVLGRFPRLVRDLASATGKNIQLQVSGEETEMDKTVVDSLSDPLTHLIRNSVDHGSETPEERRLAGKPEECTIGLRIFHQGGSVMVEVTDDGRGLNTEKIREKAIERNMIARDAQTTDDDIQQLIFAPGFSTADKVTDLSGRGVGMDVVKRNVQALNGNVSITSVRGAGTCVRMKLPLTMAILDGLLVKVGAQTYVVPLTSILESIRPKTSQISSMAGRGETVVVRGEPIPLLRLHSLFGVVGAVTDPSKGLAVLVEDQGHHLALLVDELLGQQQVVVKSLEANFRKLDGIAGATILGDGQAALIIDVSGLVQIQGGAAAA